MSIEVGDHVLAGGVGPLDEARPSANHFGLCEADGPLQYTCIGVDDVIQHLITEDNYFGEELAPFNAMYGVSRHDAKPSAALRLHAQGMKLPLHVRR